MEIVIGTLILAIGMAIGQYGLPHPDIYEKELKISELYMQIDENNKKSKEYISTINQLKTKKVVKNEPYKIDGIEIAYLGD